MFITLLQWFKIALGFIYVHKYLWGAVIVVGRLSALAARLLHGSTSVITMVTLNPPPLVYHRLRWQMNLWLEKEEIKWDKSGEEELGNAQGYAR